MYKRANFSLIIYFNVWHSGDTVTNFKGFLQGEGKGSSSDDSGVRREFGEVIIRNQEVPQQCWTC